MRLAAMISGTSHDAIDVAVAEVWAEGDELLLCPLGTTAVPFAAELRQRIVDVLPPQTTELEEVCRLDALLGQAFGEAAAGAIEELAGGHVDLVVSHGQTVFHLVVDGRAESTLQLGQPAWIAERTGAPVLADLRSRDIAAGGHGAPLVSLVDALLLGRPDVAEVALNLGGISNITVVGPVHPPLAYDVGPANALIDAAISRSTGGVERYDRGGARAARGQVDDVLLDRLLAEPYYALAPPRSTGKELFHPGYLDAVLAAHETTVTIDDLLATLVELTARTVADACRSHGARRVVAAGGGVNNPVLMDRLARHLAGAELTTIDALGLPSDAKEAYAFAVLGFLSVNGVPGALPSCTGARRASVLGALLPGADGRLPAPGVPAGWHPTRLRVEAAT